MAVGRLETLRAYSRGGGTQAETFGRSQKGKCSSARRGRGERGMRSRCCVGQGRNVTREGGGWTGSREGEGTCESRSEERRGRGKETPGRARGMVSKSRRLEDDGSGARSARVDALSRPHWRVGLNGKMSKKLARVKLDR